MRRSLIPTALGFLLTLVLAACGGNDSNAGHQAGTAAVSADRAHAIAQNMLVAYNSGDYQAFSRDWSSPVKLVVASVRSGSSGTRTCRPPARSRRSPA